MASQHQKGVGIDHRTPLQCDYRSEWGLEIVRISDAEINFRCSKRACMQGKASRLRDRELVLHGRCSTTLQKRTIKAPRIITEDGQVGCRKRSSCQTIR